MRTLDSREKIHEWLVARVAATLNIAKDAIDPDAPFSQYALDSLGAVTLVMDLEQELGTDLPPTLLWDYPSVHQCVAFLAAHCKTATTRKELAGTNAN